MHITALKPTKTHQIFCLSKLTREGPGMCFFDTGVETHRLGMQVLSIRRNGALRLVPHTPMASDLDQPA